MTLAIDTLLSIMTDEDAWLGLRIEAADGLLSFEAPPEYVEAAKAFLTSVFADPGQDDEFRMRSLKLMRKVEARKVMPSTVKPRTLSTLCSVRPYFRQCTPPEFSAMLPPIVHAIWLDGSGA